MQQCEFTSDPLKAIQRVIASLQPSTVVLLTDRRVGKLYAGLIEQVSKHVLIAPESEHGKQLSVAEELWANMLQLGADRQTVLINLGGGAISDLGGWVAANYMRGIRFVNVPTTLLAQIDASYGGKVGINFQGQKNMLGRFVLPETVIVSEIFLETLSKEQLRDGFSEGFKHAFICEPELLPQLRACSDQKLTQPSLRLIQQLAGVKEKFVTRDFHESSTRKVLNFGHTVGHALEALCAERGIECSHGQAVVEGMVMEAFLSIDSVQFSEEDYGELKTILVEFGYDTTRSLRMLLEEFTSQELAEAILNIALRDKKNRNRVINWVQLRTLGDAAYDIEIDPINTLELIREFIETLRS